MRGHYLNEKEGQIEFFDEFAIPWRETPVLVDYTDGVYRGTLFEFKLVVTDLNKVVFQAVKYLSRLRIRGEDVPGRFLIVSLNTLEAYEYASKDFFEAIHTVYFGGPSTGNAGFSSAGYRRRFALDSESDVLALVALLREETFLPVRIDENSIVGWAERYYRENPMASKGDFLGDAAGQQVRVTGEIRRPVYFRGKILPYTGRTNERFRYLMDKLNDRLSRKILGAFYTPVAYARLAAELVKEAVARVPEGNDYVIIDRCAGTGNLEDVLPDEILSHCILSTYEYYEYKVLFERLHDRVRFIIPPTEGTVQYQDGFVKNADAMSRDFLENHSIRAFVDNPRCTVILLENPPYRDDLADNGAVRRSYVFERFKERLSEYPNANISTARDLLNQFVWSAREYYLRQPTDSYVLFCPLKAWKTLGLLDLECGRGFLFNRKHFHAGASSVCCALWANVTSREESIGLDAYDIAKDGSLSYVGWQVFHKAVTTLDPLFDRSRRPGDREWDVYCETSGMQTTGRRCDGKSYTGDDIIGYLRTDSFGIDPKHVSLTRCTLFNIRGFYLRKDNVLRLLPLYAAKCFPQDLWYEKDVFVSSADGGREYEQDADFVKSCFLFTCLHQGNKCRSFYALDGGESVLCRNELCFDEGTFASELLGRFMLTDEERALLSGFRKTLSLARVTVNYNRDFSYGPFQIKEELNTFSEVDGVNVPDYVELNSELSTLKVLLKAYYMESVRPLLFRYQLLK